ncbi:hypothetical protein HYS28_03835 [Candidatus Uhrbacteria bacterium]|nr:hypothetical protein [Candidatus Uhrbacteria bacterium]
MLEQQDLQAIRGIVKEEVGTAIETAKVEIITAVGEMLEDNVFPHFEEVHRELRKLKTVAGWQT